jgi:hypothetical protein
MKNIRSLLVPFLAIAFVAVSSCLVYALILLSGERAQRIAALDLASDTLETSRNKENQETARRKTIALEAGQLRAYKAATDPELRRLAALAAQYGRKLQAAAVFRSEVRIPKIESAATVSRPDSVDPGPAGALSVSAAVQDSAAWFRAQVNARIDSLGRAWIALDSVRVRLAYELVFRRYRAGFLGYKSEDVAEVKSLNPYATTTALQAFKVPAADRRAPFVFGALCSLLATAAALKIIGAL